MKRKITVKVSMAGDDWRSKAMQAVSCVRGVTSVTIEGPEKDRVVVVGEDIDTVYMLVRLRKMTRGDAEIVIVEEIKPPPPPPQESKTKTEDKPPPPPPPPTCRPPCHRCPPPPPPQSCQSYSCRDPSCIIM